MARRIYWETVYKWLIKNKISVSSSSLAVIGIFVYLTFFGLIEVHSVSGDVVCAGDDIDPCYGYIDFTPNEDIYIYPIGHDPYGRNTPFEFDKPIKDFSLQRSWGLGYRTINLSKTWSVKVKYAVKFSKGIRYKIRIKVLKDSPLQDIKWWSDGLGVEDPVFLASKNLSIGQVCIRNRTNSVVDKSWTVELTGTVPCTIHNDTCLLNKTSNDYYKLVSWKEERYSYKNITVCDEWENSLDYGDKQIPINGLGIKCKPIGKLICCDDCVYDGNCNGIFDRLHEDGMCYIVGNKIDYIGRKKDRIENRFVKVGIV